MSHIQTLVSIVLEDMKQLPLFCRMKNQKGIKRDVAMKDTYVIDVQDPGNALDALMFVLAIDAENVPGIK